MSRVLCELLAEFWARYCARLLNKVFGGCFGGLAFCALALYMFYSGLERSGCVGLKVQGVEASKVTRSGESNPQTLTPKQSNRKTEN